ncbi:MAG: low affinity iron permease family protein [Bacteroidota bacterium]
MKKQKTVFKKNAFEQFAFVATKAAGSTAAFACAAGLILAWLISGPLFGFSDTWQLVINTGTTIITFLMVFLIQKTQNKDSIVIQVKLNELVAADGFASNRIIDVEDLTEQELNILHQYYRELAEMTKKATDIRSSHSVEEARSKHEMKMKKVRFSPLKKTANTAYKKHKPKPEVISPDKIIKKAETQSVKTHAPNK